jgi:hypothetical protein
MHYALSFLKQDLYSLIRADWDAEFTHNAPISLKGDLHLSSIDIQRPRRTDSDAGSAMGTAILMPFNILSQGLDMDAYFTEVFEPCL